MYDLASCKSIPFYEVNTFTCGAALELLLNWEGRHLLGLSVKALYSWVDMVTLILRVVLEKKAIRRHPFLQTREERHWHSQSCRAHDSVPLALSGPEPQMEPATRRQ